MDGEAIEASAGVLVPLSPNNRARVRPCPPVGAFGHVHQLGETEAGLDRRMSTITKIVPRGAEPARSRHIRIPARR